MSDLDREIGKRLREARKLRGYKSARAFAIEQKIPESTYSQHETGKRSLNPEIVLRYCECLQVNPGWLLSGREVSESVSESSASEVSLNSSNRQAGHQFDNASMMIMDNLITVEMDIFKGVLKKAMQKYVGSEMDQGQIEEFIDTCLQNFNAIARFSSDYKSKEADKIATA